MENQKKILVQQAEMTRVHNQKVLTLTKVVQVLLKLKVTLKTLNLRVLIKTVKKVNHLLLLNTVQKIRTAKEVVENLLTTMMMTKMARWTATKEESD